MVSILERMIASILLLVALASGAGFASVGGPEGLKLIGFERSSMRLYYEYRVGYERPQQYFYLDLGTEGPSEPVELVDLYPEDPGDPRDSYPNQGLVRSKLVKRSEYVEEFLPENAQIRLSTLSTGKWTHQGISYEVPSFELRIDVSADGFSGAAVVEAYCNKRVSVLRWGKIPELPIVVAHVTYTGIPIEECYSKPVIVVLRPEGND
jgi:hypothetical protein